MYGWGANEELVGRAIAGRRDEVFLATKFGNVRGPNGEFLGVRGDPEYVRSPAKRASSASTSRDRPLLPASRRHRGCRSRTRSARCRASRTRARSATSASPKLRRETIRAAHAALPITAVQTELSLWSRDAGGRGASNVRELGIGYVAYSPLGRGFLTGQIQVAGRLSRRRFPQNHPRFQGENFEKNLDLVNEVEEMARGEGLHHGAARARLGARPGRRHRPDPRDQACQISRREYRRSGREAQRRGPEAPRIPSCPRSSRRANAIMHEGWKR